MNKERTTRRKVTDSSFTNIVCCADYLPLCFYLCCIHTICFSVTCQERYVPAKIKFILPRKVRRFFPCSLASARTIPAPSRLHPVHAGRIWLDIQHGRSIVGIGIVNSYNTVFQIQLRSTSAAVSASGLGRAGIWLQISPLSRGRSYKAALLPKLPLPLRYRIH